MMGYQGPQLPPRMSSVSSSVSADAPVDPLVVEELGEGHGALLSVHSPAPLVSVIGSPPLAVLLIQVWFLFHPLGLDVGLISLSMSQAWVIRVLWRVQ